MFQDDDYNGECFIAGGSGEAETLDDTILYHIPRGSTQNLGAPAPFTNLGANQQARGILEEVYILNVIELTKQGLNISGDDARKIAYLRMLLLRDGFILYGDTPQQHHCRYTLVRETTLAQNARQNPEVTTQLDDKIRKILRRTLYNAICMVAYCFRVRAHHYVTGMDELYTNLYRRTLVGEETYPLSWKYLAREVMKVIFPDQLDDIWRECIQRGLCAGTLVKRYDCLAAGSAGVGALHKGLLDLGSVFPKFLEQHQEDVDYINGVVSEIKDNRWRGSINHAFYNETLITADENRICRLASIVLGALKTLAPSSPLGNSAALKRIADNAPLTGAFVTQMLLAASRKAGENTEMLTGPTVEEAP